MSSQIVEEWHHNERLTAFRQTRLLPTKTWRSLKKEIPENTYYHNYDAYNLRENEDAMRLLAEIDMYSWEYPDDFPGIIFYLMSLVSIGFDLFFVNS